MWTSPHPVARVCFAAHDACHLLRWRRLSVAGILSKKVNAVAVEKTSKSLDKRVHLWYTIFNISVKC